MRAFLTMLGIIIGIAAIVIIIAVGNGAQSLVINQVNSLGSDIIAILPGASDESGAPATALGISVTSLKTTDADAIRKNVQGLAGVAAYVKGVGTITAGNQSVDSNFTGTSADYPQVENITLSQGTFFSAEDDRSLAKVAVLGWGVYQDLFPGRQAVGESIRIKRQSFRVIGVVTERGTEGFQNQDDQVFIPLETAQNIMLGIDYLGFIRAKALPGQDLSIIAEDIRALLRDRHGLTGKQVNDFSVRTITQALDILSTVTDVLKYFLAAISALSLLVGGIGIMNIMLVAVLERTREIGLRKAVGARGYDLRIQFLAETIIITMMGGIIGFILGFVVAYLISVLAHALGYYWEFSVGWSSVALAIVFPLLTGLIFGYYPAQKAASLKPIEALHYE